jgi:hypothetical protein
MRLIEMLRTEEGHRRNGLKREGKLTAVHLLRLVEQIRQR